MQHEISESSKTLLTLIDALLGKSWLKQTVQIPWKIIWPSVFIWKFFLQCTSTFLINLVDSWRRKFCQKDIRWPVKAKIKMKRIMSRPPRNPRKFKLIFKLTNSDCWLSTCKQPIYQFSWKTFRIAENCICRKFSLSVPNKYIIGIGHIQFYLLGHIQLFRDRRVEKASTVEFFAKIFTTSCQNFDLSQIKNVKNSAWTVE